jgi:NADH-quinone oxidoreductase subunit A
MYVLKFQSVKRLILENASQETVKQTTDWIIIRYGENYADYSIALWFLAGAVAIGLIAVILARYLAPHEPNPAKRSTYECSEQPVGSAWIRFNIRYYFFALLFLVFDVEIVFFYPWAVVFKTLKTEHYDEFNNLVALGFPIFGEMLVFLFLLFLGWAYAWRKGYLSWD